MPRRSTAGVVGLARTCATILLLVAALTVEARPGAAAPAIAAVAPAIAAPAPAINVAAPAVNAEAPLVGPVRVDLYRPGVCAMQATWSWCTAASVQIMRNIATGSSSHAAAEQDRFFAYMHARDRYEMPSREGVDPQGFRAGLRQFVDPRYAIVASTSYEWAVRSAVLRLRQSKLPVALIVDAGRHAWVLTGFTATADPAVTAAFRVISVRIVGPLYGRQSLNGYDPPPNTSLSFEALRRYLLPYAFKFGPTPWDRRYVTFQAIGGLAPPVH